MLSQSSIKNFSVYVAYLRGLYLLHQNHHWQIKDEQFYGAHLLFQRLYEEVAQDADQAAEKCVSHCGPDAMNLAAQMEYLQTITRSYKAIKAPNLEQAVQISLRAEKNFLKVSQFLYDTLKEAGDLTLGLDDFIMATASASEDRCYLLQQNLL